MSYTHPLVSYKYFIQRNLTTQKILIFLTIYFIAAFNIPLLNIIADQHGTSSIKDYGFMLSAYIFIGLIIYAILLLLSFKFTFKPWVIILLMSSSSASYFMNKYHILIDASMLQNTLETDYQEARGLFSWELMITILLFGILPSCLLLISPVKYSSELNEFIKKIIGIFIALAGISLIAVIYYQDYASLFRNNRQLRDQLIPLNSIYAAISYIKPKFSVMPEEMKALGVDAKLGSHWNAAGKKVVAIVVVGETARAANFSLSGYKRETNPSLKNENIIYLKNMHSCGTATATSVPCMFSHLTRKNYDDTQAKHEENVLDVIRRSGLGVLWRDNNSGCKGACSRVDVDDLSHFNISGLCNKNECFDPVLLDKLKEKIDSYDSEKGLVIVLHQKGSHGPAYFERVPSNFQIFKPFCHTNQIQECTQDEIINAYDNTIAYTDYTLSLIINFLKDHQDSYDSSLIYMSDHGESLGENNLYLHGLPYAIAPEEQTHIPALIWLSKGFANTFNIDSACLQNNAAKPYSHDNLFHSLLGMLNIQTSVYDPVLDIFKACQTL